MQMLSSLDLSKILSFDKVLKQGVIRLNQKIDSFVYTVQVEQEERTLSLILL